MKRISTTSHLLLLFICSIVFLSTSYSQIDLHAGLVASYPFIGNANDSSGGGNNGTNYGAILSNDRFGRENNCYSFDGSSNYIAVPDDSLLDFGTNNFSISLWVRTSIWQVGCYLIAKYPLSLGAGYGIGTGWNNDPYAFMINNLGLGKEVRGGIPINDGKWHNYTVVWNRNGFLTVYVDGVSSTRKDMSDVSAGSVSNDGILTIGGCEGYQLFNGELDDIRIYNRVLNQEEIDSLYHESGWWPVETQPTPSLVQVESGTFTAGATPVTISTFKIDKYEVTYDLWTTVRTWALTHGYTDLTAGQNGYNPSGSNNPVTMVNWYDVVKWCNARSEKDGLLPAYYTDSTQSNIYRTGDININIDAVKWTSNGYRLPTDCEWEFAARGGNSTHGYTYSGSNTIGDVAWYNSNSSGTRTVGIKSANELGIYDMSGNVWEWCWDWFDGSYPSGGTTDPRGASTTQIDRLIRGGTCLLGEIYCQVGDRNSISSTPTIRFRDWGFRCAQTEIDTTTWRMQLKASIASYKDIENYLGVSDYATDGQDASFDVAEPPASPGSYVSLFFPHPEWSSILGINFANDIKKNTSLADTVKRWYFQVQSNVLNDTVELIFADDRIPLAFGKYLTDLTSGERINIKTTSLYKYCNTSETARSFMLIIGDTTAPSLSLTLPNGSNIWRSRTNKTIQWNTSDGTGIDSVFVFASSNGGSSYDLISSLGGAQSFNWTVPSEYLNHNYSIKIVSRDSLGNLSTTRSAKTFTVVGDSLAKSNAAGWTLISLPLTPYDSSVVNMFGLTSYFWTYTQATGYTQPSKMALGNGYWLGLTALKNWYVKGTASEMDSSVQDLQLGYNIIGNNFVRNVSKNNFFFLKSGSYYDFNSAIAGGLISNTLYGYASSAYSSIDTMSLFGGYWIGVLQSGVQLIQKPNYSIVIPLAKQMKIFALNWDLPISVKTASLADNIATIGIRAATTVDFDPLYDAPRPPRNPGNKYLEMYFSNSGGNYPAVLGSKYARDYRGSDNPQWSFTVESSEQGTVTIQWDPNMLKQLGGNVRLALIDQSISSSINMETQSNYSFDYSGARVFTIASTITGVDENSENKPTSYALKQNYPNPFNPSTQIEYSLPQHSFVILKVYDMLGKELATLVNGDRETGNYSLTWSAQNCPSGVYFYRLTAGSYTMTKKLLLLR